ncbi:MAG: hypothetical protein GX483_04715 [Actinomycetaceae bacterium]|nr:hypothetical protein [Actinomycetaceae bacterium]
MSTLMNLTGARFVPLNKDEFFTGRIVAVAGDPQPQKDRDGNLRLSENGKPRYSVNAFIEFSTEADRTQRLWRNAWLSVERYPQGLKPGCRFQTSGKTVFKQYTIDGQPGITIQAETVEVISQDDFDFFSSEDETK